MNLESYHNYHRLLLNFENLTTLSDYQGFLREIKEIKQTNTIDLYQKKFIGEDNTELLKTALLETAFQTLSYHALIDFINVNFYNEEKRTKFKQTLSEEEEYETQFEIEDIAEQSNKILLNFAAKNNHDKKATRLMSRIAKKPIKDNSKYEYREIRRCFKDIDDAIKSPNETMLEDYFFSREKIENLDLTKEDLKKVQKLFCMTKKEYSTKTLQKLALEYLDLPSFTALIYSSYDGKEIDQQIKSKESMLQQILFINTQKNSEDNIKNIKNLIGSGADVNAQNQNGNTALHLAVYNNNEETAKSLIEFGADVNAQNQNGNTALHLAVYNNNKETAKSLIEFGADVNAQNQNGDTALHLAVYNNNEETAKALISDKANTSIENKFGQNPLNYALANKQNALAVIITNDLYSKEQIFI
jgi:hypothetical protein